MAEINVTKDNFTSEILKSNIPVLVDLWASWCGPCTMLAPVIEEIANEADGKFKVCKINVDEEPELAAAFGVSSIPMIVVVKDGGITNQSVGYQSKEDILALL